MEIGREARKFIKDALNHLDRIAKANEELIRLATEEREIEYEQGPAYCPHCTQLDPSIRMGEGGGSLSTFVLIAMCDNCQKTLFGVPIGWRMAKTKEEAAEIRSELKEGAGDVSS